jgi:hypothetical protein
VRPDHEEYVEGELCPPHLLVFCGMCGEDVCDECGVHFIDDEEVDECPESTDT